MTSAATGADCSAASNNGTPKFLQLLGKRVTNKSSGCGLTYGVLVLNRNIRSANKDCQRSTPTAEESNYLSCFLCISSPYRKRDRNLLTGRNRLLLHSLVFQFCLSRHSKQNHLPSLFCAAQAEDIVPGLSKPLGYPETARYYCISNSAPTHPSPTTMEMGLDISEVITLCGCLQAPDVCVSALFSWSLVCSSQQTLGRGSLSVFPVVLAAERDRNTRKNKQLLKIHGAFSFPFCRWTVIFLEDSDGSRSMIKRSMDGASRTGHGGEI